MKRLLRSALQAIGLLTVLGAVAAVVAFFWLASLLQVEERIERADYILPLAGDWHRQVRAAELYSDGIAPKVLFSRDRKPPLTRVQAIVANMGYPPLDPWQFPPKLLAHLGVPPQAIEPFGNGHVSTVEEAEALRRHLDGRRVKIVLVTSPYHSRRALMVFQNTMPEMEWLSATTPEDTLPARWWTDRQAAIHAVLESAKLLHYWLGGAFRASETVR